MAQIYGAAHHPCQHTTFETCPPQNQRSHSIPLASSFFTSSIPFIPLLTTAPLPTTLPLLGLKISSRTFQMADTSSIRSEKEGSY